LQGIILDQNHERIRMIIDYTISRRGTTPYWAKL